MKNRTIVKILFTIYILVILSLTVFARDGFMRYPLFSHGNFNISLFTDLKMVLSHSVKRFLYLFLGNILTFIPFGFFMMPLVDSKRKKSFKAFFTTLTLGAVFSISIELMQWAFGVGVSELDDVILNTLGIMIGATICLPFRNKIRNK